MYATWFFLLAAAADKPAIWTEVRSPNFTVVSDAGEKQARRAADQFEQIRAVFADALKMRVDPGKPVIILAAKNQNTLKTLLPRYWEVKGGIRPAGVYLGGREKHYVAMRLDAEGENPFHVVYHEYVHMLLHLNFRDLPRWLNEGLAEFYGHTVIREREVVTGQPSVSHVLRLRDSRLLDLATFFAVDHDSPHYNERDRASIFYAQAWALTHYFILGEKGAHRSRLIAYMQAQQKEGDSEDALVQAFGELRALEKKLRDYVGQSAFYQATLPRPAKTAPESYAARALSEAESLAARGDFLARSQRPKEAEALLREAIRLDPKLAAGHEALGFLRLAGGQRDAAAESFGKAADLDAASYFAFYYRAMTAMRRDDAGPEIERDLRRALEINPQFAPAYSALAQFFLRQRDPQAALAPALKAAELEPGELYHHVNAGQVLLALERFDEARRLGERVRALAHTDDDRQLAAAFAENIRQYVAYAEKNKSYAEEYRRLSQERSQGARAAALQQQGHSQVRGVVHSVVCRPPSSFELTLVEEDTNREIKLRGDLRKVEFSSSVWEPPANFDACKHIVKLRADVVFAGSEVVSIEILSQP